MLPRLWFWSWKIPGLQPFNQVCLSTCNRKSFFSEEGFKLFDCHFIRINCSVEEDGVGGPTQRQCTNVGGQFASKSSLPCLPLTSIVDGDTSLGGFLRPATPAPLLSFLVEKALMNDYMFSSLLCLWWCPMNAMMLQLGPRGYSKWEMNFFFPAWLNLCGHCPHPKAVHSWRATATMPSLGIGRVIS